MGDGRCHTFLFADLVGFTTFTELNGDDAAADAAVRFAAAVSDLARAAGAAVVKCMGDGVMLRCDDAAAAVRLGLTMHDELAQLEGLPSIHAGAHSGCAVERGGDWFGATVNLAARVADAARAGELLVTEATVAAAGHVRGVAMESLGPRVFRNVTSVTSIYAARRVARRHAEAPLWHPPLGSSAPQPAAA
jgi:adenylate cyclase